jgi:hypothetical protein
MYKIYFVKLLNNVVIIFSSSRLYRCIHQNNDFIPFKTYKTNTNFYVLKNNEN